MSWTNDDSQAGAPTYKINANSANTGTDLYGTQVVGLGDEEYAHQTHTGWTRVQRGTGPVKSITITVAGSGYANTDTINISGGLTNATGTIATDANGAITTVTLGANGTGFINVSTANVSITTSAGTGATLTPVLGGRAGRVQTEVLVALTGMTSNNSTLA
jgi:hypothetical protein